MHCRPLGHLPCLRDAPALPPPGACLPPWDAPPQARTWDANRSVDLGLPVHGNTGAVGGVTVPNTMRGKRDGREGGYYHMVIARGQKAVG